jgi:hypothetical protein
VSRIGEVLPADDDVARWVLVLALARNDLALTRTQLVEAFGKDRTALHWSRLLAGHLCEVAHFLRRDSNRPVIRDFARGLPDKPKRVYRELLRPDFLKVRLEGDRNRVFHYPSTDLGAEDKGGPALRDALATVHDLEAALVVKWGKDGKAEDMRFDFADQVAVQFAMADFGTTKAEQKKSIVAVRENAAKVIWLADAVFHHYTETEGGGLQLGEPKPLDDDSAGESGDDTA